MASAQQDNMAQFFDFSGISLPQIEASHVALATEQSAGDDLLPDLSNAPETFRNNCASHPYEACLCDKIIADFGLNEPDCDTSLQPENYANFKAWIPRYSKPDRACEYCRTKGLECFFTYEGQHFCSPCNALFRQCSFNHHMNPNVVMDTLHTVAEDQVQEQGALTGITAMKSWDRAGFDYLDEDGDRSGRKMGTRFPRSAVKILKEWMDTHTDHPYPSEREKEELQELTGLNATQITNWMANTRRRRKTRTRGVSPSIRSPTWATGDATGTATNAIDIPFDKKSIRHNGKTWDIMNPLERWQESPPENEPAPIPVIMEAVQRTKSSRNGSHSSLSSSAGARPGLTSSAGSSSSFAQKRAPSITSLETGQSDSFGSLLSSGSLGSSQSQNSRNSFGSNRAKDRRRRRRTAANPSKSKRIQEMRPFQCTFCTDRFRTKYDWARHEKSLHLSLEKWICAPLGPITSSATGQTQCVYCGEINPSIEHLETHNHNACEEKGMDARTFYRKDHLRQHLRLVHGCKMLDSMDVWKSEATFIKSRCGFCKAEFTRWQDRIDHLAKHFRDGAQMNNWKGCRGLDPAVAAQVTNAMPPYLIGNESLSPFPFSASNESTWGQFRGTVGPGNDLEFRLAEGPNWESLIGPEAIKEAVDTTMPDFEGMLTSTALAHDFSPDTNLPGLGDDGGPLWEAFDYGLHHSLSSRSPAGHVTCWEILTVSLGQYARDQMALGIIPTDEQLQTQARRITYSDEDAWNQTAADNAEWLELFKKAYGMPSKATDLRVDLDEDLGVSFEGLGFEGQTSGQNSGDWGASVTDAHLGLGQLGMMGMDLPATTMGMGMSFPHEGRSCDFV